MSFVHGSKSALYLGNADRSSYITGADLSVETDVADTTTWGSTWKTAIPGASGGTLSVSGLYDPVLVEFWDNLAAAPGTALTYLPEGQAAVGASARVLGALGTSYHESSPVGGVVAFNWAAQADNRVGFGILVRTMVETAGTTTGDSINNGAASATGWSANLHVAVVTSGSWVVKIEDSANNSDWADLSGAAFTAATGATSQRLVSADPAAAVRRYLRFVATVTGGSSPTIWFALAFARS